MTPPPLRWGTIGTGRIAHDFAEGLSQYPDGVLTAIGSRSAKEAADFAVKFPAPHVHDSYEDLLANPEVEIVYISTPHPMHAEWAIRAAKAGKHILCEKPLTMNLSEAREVVAAVRAAGVFLMEAYIYRCQPQTARIVEMLRGGAIGDLRMIEASRSFAVDFHAESRLFNRELGGGGILDIGCYPLSTVRLLAGAALGLPFADPLEVQGMGALSPETGVDLWAAALMRFDRDIIARLSCGIHISQPERVVLSGSLGTIEVSRFWSGPWKDQPSELRFQPHRQPAEVIPLPWETNRFVSEIDAVTRAIRNGQLECECTTLEDTLGNMATLDRWRQSIGLSYDADSALR